MTNEIWNLPVLPQGWVWTDFESISGELKAGGTPLTKVKKYYDDGTIPFVKIEDIVSSSKYLFETKTNITEQGLRNSSAWLVPRGSLLYSMYASYGEPIINKIEVTTSQAIIAYVPLQGLIVLDYVYYYLKKVRTELTTRGTTQKNLNAQIVRRIPIPLAPFNEQVRIVAKLEELFTRLDAGVEGLRKVKAQLKRYRQAVLKYAFEGKLTEEWRKTHKHETEPATKLLERIGRQIEINVKGKRKKSSRMDMPLNQELSEGWTCGRLEDWIYIAGRIGWRGLKAGEYTSEGPLFLSVYNLNKGIKVDFSEAQHITEERYEESPEIQLQNNDILLVKDGAGIGKIGIVEGLNTKATVNSSLLVIRGSDVFLPKFLLYFLMGPKMQEVVKMRITGSATPHLFQRDIKRFDVLIPPIAEQQKVVESIESSFSVADEVENTIKQGLRQAEALRQSILRDAFQGKLVPQDSSDEPADKLLERIREEKAKSKGKKDTNRGRKNKPKQLELSTYVK